MVTPPNASKRATSLDVAKLAGVSRTQVSYTFSEPSSSHVSPEKRDLILAAARELGYQPHQSAQALRKGFSNEFGLFFPAPYTPRINSMLGVIHEMGLANRCMPTQYSFNSYHDASRKRDAFEAMLARRPAGFFCSLLDLDRADLAYAQSKGVSRILVLDVEQHDDLVTLHLPVEQVGFVAAQHLLALGHRRLGIIKPADPIQARGYALRLKGMRRAMHGCDDAEVVEIDWPRTDLRPTYPAAREVVAGVFLGSTAKPSAIYAFSDDYAFVLLAALSDAGIRVPADVSIVGTDDHPLSSLVRPSLTTVRFDTGNLGLSAVNMINALLTEDVTDVAVRERQEPDLVSRNTTAHFLASFAL